MARDVKLNVRNGDQNNAELHQAILENAATEETLQELLAVTKNKSDPKSKLNQSLNKAGKSAETFSTKAQDQSEVMDISAAATEKQTKSIGDLSKSMDHAKDKMAPVGEKVADSMGIMQRASMSNAEFTQDFGNQMAGAADGAGHKLGEFGAIARASGGKIAILGGAATLASIPLMALGGFVSLVVAPLALLISVTDEMADNFIELSRTGFLFDSSVGSTINSINRADMTFQQFTNFIERNNDALQSFSLSVTQGARRVMAIRNAMSEELEESFVNMGIAVQEIPDVVARMQALQGRYGRATTLSLEEQAESTKDLYTVQRALADLTGQSVEAIQEEMMARSRSATIQNTLMSLPDELRGQARESFSATAGMVSGLLGDEMGSAFEAVFAQDFGSEEFRQLQALSPEMVQIFTDLRTGIMNGSLDSEQALATLEGRLSSQSDSLIDGLQSYSYVFSQSNAEAFGAFRDSYGQTLEVLDLMSQGNGEIAERMQDIRNQMAGITTDSEGNETRDDLLSSFSDLVESTAQIASSIDALKTSAVDELAPAISSVIEDITGWVQSGSIKFQQFTETMDPVLTALRTFGDILGNIVGFFTGSNLEDQGDRGDYRTSRRGTSFDPDAPRPVEDDIQAPPVEGRPGYIRRGRRWVPDPNYEPPADVPVMQEAPIPADIQNMLDEGWRAPAQIQNLEESIAPRVEREAEAIQGLTQQLEQQAETGEDPMADLIPEFQELRQSFDRMVNTTRDIKTLTQRSLDEQVEQNEKLDNMVGTMTTGNRQSRLAAMGRG